MTPLPCPKCGHDCRPELDAAQNWARRVVRAPSERTVLTTQLGLIAELRFVVRAIGCPCCDELVAFDPGLSLDGVGPERLVPVEVGA